MRPRAGAALRDVAFGDRLATLPDWVYVFVPSSIKTEISRNVRRYPSTWRRDTDSSTNATISMPRTMSLAAIRKLRV